MDVDSMDVDIVIDCSLSNLRFNGRRQLSIVLARNLPTAPSGAKKVGLSRSLSNNPTCKKKSGDSIDREIPECRKEQNKRLQFCLLEFDAQVTLQPPPLRGYNLPVLTPPRAIAAAREAGGRSGRRRQHEASARRTGLLQTESDRG